VVDPVSDDGDRVVLDEVLRQAAAAGLWVGSHPDVIAKMGTTEVLYRTRGLGWGTDTDLYTSAADFARRFPARLATDGVRVVKPSRGNAGIGVWKVALLHPEAGAPVGPHSPVRLQHALVRDHSSEETTLRAFLARCQPAFAAYGGTGTLVDQAFCRRIDQGIVRCYMVGDRLVGFARQYPKGLSPEERSADPSADPPPVELIMGLPSPKTMFGPDEPAFGRLRADLENRFPRPAAAAPHRHAVAARPLGRRLPLRPPRRLGGGPLHPLRDQRQLGHALPRRSAAGAGGSHPGGGARRRPQARAGPITGAGSGPRIPQDGGAGGRAAGAPGQPGRPGSGSTPREFRIPETIR
jgi:hypothetical protein